MRGKDTQKLSNAESKRLRRILLLVAIGAVLFLLFAPGRGLMSFWRIQKQVATLSRQNALLEQRNRELESEIERLQNDDAYLEELARKKYGLLKEDETVYEFKSGHKK